MARRKKKMTAFSKLLIFLLVATPVLFLGISYAIGQDGIGNVKSLLGITKKTQETSKSYTPPASISIEERDEMYKQIEEMKRQLREKNTQIKELHSEVEKLKSGNNQ